jgi:uncharacterized protein YfaP (DUF2135 family)
VLGTGDVQVTLFWSGASDLDLHVFDPFNEEIYFSQRQSSSGGQLDVDMNVGCGAAFDSPVENVFWPTGAAPQGSYTVAVNFFEACGEGATDFSIRVLVDGVVVVEQSGVVTQEGETVTVATFQR